MDGEHSVQATGLSTRTLPMFQNEFYCCLEREEQDGVANFLQVLKGKTTNGDRIMYIHEKFNQFNLLEDKYQYDEKSNAKTGRYKEMSSEFFALGQYSKALKGYTKALVLTETKELSALVYANRSAALFNLGLYQECLTDIERAISHRYPKSLRPKLIERKNKATEMLQTSQGTPKYSYYEEIPTLPPDQRNPTMPCATKHVEIKACRTGTKVVATAPINIGDIISVEKSLVYVTDREFWCMYHCHECFELCYNPIPCSGCTQVLYCNHACRTKAFHSFHKYECPILLSVRRLFEKNHPLAIALKVFLQSEGNLPEEMSSLIRQERYDGDVLHLDMIMIAALMYDLVKKHTKKFDGPNGEALEIFFKENIVDLLKLGTFHTSGIMELCPTDDDKKLLNYDIAAMGVFPFYESCRHSCNPNAIPSYHGVNRVLRASRTIQSGQEVFISYGPNYSQDTKQARQVTTSMEFNFNCTCQACKENWPQLDLLPVLPPSQAYLDFVKQGQTKPDVELAKKAIPETIRVMKILEKRGEPNLRLASEENAFFHLYSVLGNKRLLP